MKALYDCAQFSIECCIIVLIYINRIMTFSGTPLHPTNWRPMLLCGLLVGQKVWDDRYLSNSDFVFIYPFFTVKEITKLEQKFLEVIQYNVIVKAKLYATYYFELRSLFKDNESEFPLKQLTKDKANELEVRSQMLNKIEKKKAEQKSSTYSNVKSEKPKYNQGAVLN